MQYVSKKERDKREWDRMFKELTDPEERLKNKRRKEKEERIKEKKSDTGYE